MKYIIRAVKYYVYICTIVVIVLAILVAAKAVSPDINIMFKNGWQSVGLIAAVFGIISAMYPMFGYSTRQASVLGETETLKGDVIAFMESRNYVLEKDEDEVMTFRSKSFLNRLFRVWEDRVTIGRCLGGFSVEGLTRDITRIIGGLEYKFRNPDLD